MNVLVAAEEAAGAHALRTLLRRRHRVVAALTQSESVRAPAAAADIPVWPPRLVTDHAFAERMSRADVDLLLNVHSLFVIHPDLLTTPRVGAFNLHPGPLPAYAGLNAPSWAIYRGERTHAVTLHWMAAEVDTGRIAYEAPFDVAPGETGLSLSLKCVRFGLPLIEQLIETAATAPGSIPAIDQDLGRRRYFGRNAPHDGWVPWQLPARRVEAFLRAGTFAPFPSPWGPARAYIDGEVVNVRRVRPTGRPADRPPGTVERRPKGLLVATADEWLVIEHMTPLRRGEDRTV
jgi:UDP-4-amino-4-deoxy-L-arabinose formyltransferase/UDP-glucuronic acid dehydrogenase (UDP-4-keto-hexauronic acid decarboxylating)